MKKRLFSVLLCCIMLIGLLPTAAFAASGQLWLGNTNVLETPKGSGYNYDADANTLTLSNYQSTSTRSVSMGQRFNTAACLYTTIDDLTIAIQGNCSLGDIKNTKQYLTTKDEDTWTAGIVAASSTSGSRLTIKTLDSSSSLTVNTHFWPLMGSNVTIQGKGSVTFNSGMNGSDIQGALTVEGGGNVTMASMINGKYIYSGASIGVPRGGGLTVEEGTTLTVTSNGVAFTGNPLPKALEVKGYVDVYGTLKVASNGSNSGDGCQGYGLYVEGNLTVYSGGSVDAESNGRNTKKDEYDGKEAVYVTGELGINSNGYLHAQTKNNKQDSGGAIYAGSWNIRALDGEGNLINNAAVLTKPGYGAIDGNRVSYLGSNVREVELQGIRRCTLKLSISGKYKYWGYGSSEYNAYTGDLDLTKGAESLYKSRALGGRDYQAFQGIDVKSGEHTVVLDGIIQGRDGSSYITVRKGATLNLKIKGANYLEQSSSSQTPAVLVEDGGTLNVIGDSDYAALTLTGGSTVLKAGKDANVTFKNCVVYTKWNKDSGSNMGHIGNDVYASGNCNISIEKCWLRAGLHGNLTITNSTVSGTYDSYDNAGKVRIDNKSNVEIQGSDATPPTGVTDGSNTPVYQTVVNLHNCRVLSNKNTGKLSFQYTLDRKESSQVWPINKLRLALSNGQTLVVEPSTMMTVSGTIVLWLPEGTKVDSVYAYDDGSGSQIQHIHVANKGEDIITKDDNSAGGTLYLRNLLLGSGVLGLRGTTSADNTQFCSDYQANDSGNAWIDYDPTNGIRLQASAVATGFGIRVMSGGEGQIDLNRLNLIGSNKRIQVDEKAELTLMLIDANSMTAADSDAVLNLAGKLNILGSSGEKQLTLKGEKALAGNANAALTVDGSILVNECRDKTTPVELGSLTISGSTVIGLGTINCKNIQIDGGSVDLDVPKGTVVRNSNGQPLTKQTFVFDGITGQTKVDSITITGLPEGTTFDTGNIYTDGSGKISLWLPEGATVTEATINNTTYYPVSDGNGGTRLSTEEAPSFTAPTDNTILVLEAGKTFTLSATPYGVPTPTCQWQQSTDGQNWSDISGATGSSYSGTMNAGLHGMRFRCKATSSAGTGESKCFTLYTVPAVTDTSPTKTTFVPGESLSLTVQTETLDDVTVLYQWQVSSDGGKVWTDLANENGSVCSILVEENMDGWQYRCRVTCIYPGGETKTLEMPAKALRVVCTPVIASQPQSVTAAAGMDTAFSVTVSGSYYDLTYQWQVSTDGNKSWADVPGATGKAYSSTPVTLSLHAVTAEQNGWQYRCVLTHQSDDVKKSRASDAAALTVVGAPVITAQPKDITCLLGQDATFTVTATGNQSLSYQWQSSKDEGQTWADIPGADGVEYTLSAVTQDMDGTQYRCAVTNSAGEQSVVTLSGMARLTIHSDGSGEHSHSYSSEWKNDATNHWHECSCSDRADVAAHNLKWVVDKQATATQDGSKHEECTICGYKKAAVDIPATGSTTKPTDPSQTNPNGGEDNPQTGTDSSQTGTDSSQTGADSSQTGTDSSQTGAGSSQTGADSSHTGADSPQTSDNSHMFLWIALLFVSSGALIGTTVCSREKKRRAK